jgi:hypothetical protein
MRLFVEHSASRVPYEDVVPTIVVRRDILKHLRHVMIIVNRTRVEDRAW